MNLENNEQQFASEGGPRPLGLVVCRDGAARRLILSTLEAAGYNTMDVADGRSAMHLCIDHGDRLGVAIIDEDLPILAGHTFVAFVRRYFPALPVVLVAGHGVQAGPDGDGMLVCRPQLLHVPTTTAEILDHLHAARNQVLRHAEPSAIRGEGAEQLAAAGPIATVSGSVPAATRTAAPA
jgi:CheY-like chemotaxis protein